MPRYIDLTCCYGTYRFTFCADEPWGLDTEGLYIFLRNGGGTTWSIEYIGRADKLSDRLSCHERFPDAERIGCSEVAVCKGPWNGLLSSSMVEKALIGAYNPMLNDQHRTSDTSVSGRAALINALTPAPGFGFRPKATAASRGLSAVNLLSPGLGVSDFAGLGLLQPTPPESLGGLLARVSSRRDFD